MHIMVTTRMIHIRVTTMITDVGRLEKSLMTYVPEWLTVWL